jgi:hypothetical protein
MKKALIFLFSIMVSIQLYGCTGKADAAQAIAPAQSSDAQQQGNEQGQGTAAQEQNTAVQQQDTVVQAQDKENEEEKVTKLIKDFGSKLQMVSLLAPSDTIKKSMQESYGKYVLPELLDKWANDPLNAPGRLTSSPWPDRIEIFSIVKDAENAYQVKGEIVEITSAEKPGTGAAARRPVTLTVKKQEDQWRISDVKMEPYVDSIVYKNDRYGFRFALPSSWEGYSILSEQWEGTTVADANEKVAETGPRLSIRHPQWTNEKPRQDIPVMVFTLDQWNRLQQDQFHIGAAPVGPSELGRNSKYVFALPARYNFAFPEGFEEVDKIIQSGAFSASEPVEEK